MYEPSLILLVLFEILGLLKICGALINILGEVVKHYGVTEDWMKSKKINLRSWFHVECYNQRM